jgi:asparagine synthase (glutamine-hydrolysing)
VLSGVYDPAAPGRELTVALGAEGLVAPAAPTCVLQGRIYNLGELGQELGLAAADGSAEAMLAAAWGSWGEALLERLRGDFALLLWDPVTRSGLLARDQLGSGSLYFHATTGRLVFASEVAGVLALLPARPAPDEVALAHWLAGSGPPQGRTFYAGVGRLEEGRLLRLRDGSWEEDAYWAPRYRSDTESDREAAVSGLRQHLDVAVERRTRDSGAAVLLSGGIDSSAIAGLASAAASQTSPLRAYSAVFPAQPRADESRLIETLVGDLGIDSVRIAVEEGSPLAGGLEYLREYQLPPSSPNLFFWTPLLRRAAADGVTALMDGEGGDEVMATGYYLLADRVRRGRALAALRLARNFPGAAEHLPWRSLLSVLRDYGVRGAFRVGEPRGFRPPPAWLTPSMQAVYADSEDPWGWTRASGPRWWAQLVQAVTNSRGSVLGRDQVRQRSALAGIGASHPLLDLDLVEYVLRLDPSLAFDRHRARPLLREAVRGLIPDSLRLRPWKTNLDAVFHHGLLETDRGLLQLLLADQAAEVNAYVDPELIRRELLDGPADGQSEQARAIYLWRLATAECWLRFQSDPEAPARVLGSAQPARFEIRDHPAAVRRSTTPASPPQSS